MRNRIMVIGRDAALRARLAQLAKRSGYRAEVAESLAQARRAGLHDIALAIVASGGLDASQAAAVEELRAAVLVVGPGSGSQPGPDVIDVSDEAGLLARIAEALASQQEPKAPDGMLEFAGYRLDLAGHSLTNPAANEVPLTHNEFGLLRALVERAGRVLSRDQLLQLTAGREGESYDRSVDMQILRLRRKIEPDPTRPSLIVTVPGSGYKFAAKVTNAIGETRKLVAILAADVAGFSRLVGADEDRTLARLRALRSDLVDPAVAVHRGRVVKRTGDGAIVEFRSVVDAVRCALEVQDGMIERNAGLSAERRIEFRIGIHLGDVVAESDGDLMGDGVNIAARLEGVCEPGGICLSGAAYEHVRDRSARLLAGRSGFDQGAVIGARAWLGSLLDGRRLRADQPRRPRHCRMRARFGVGSEFGGRPIPPSGLAKITIGRPNETEAHLHEALRLSPRDNLAHVWASFAGIAKFHLGSDSEALLCFRRAIELNRNNPAAHFYLAALLALDGRLDEAQSAVQAGLASNPTFTISRFRAGAGSDNPSYLAQRERVCDGMRKAGIPEG